MSAAAASSKTVETLRKPSTGLKQPLPAVRHTPRACRDTQKTQHGIETRRDRPDLTLPGVETLRKPSTGLKLLDVALEAVHQVVETLRKPSTGLKPLTLNDYGFSTSGRDTQKTQHGIETA